jgi:tRNA-splicing ligase RtcB
MGVAARYAWANRVVLAEMVRREMAILFGADSSRLVVDVPHNVVLTEHGLNIHRKGATPARDGDLALIPGSMGDSSYVARGLGHADWLWSCSHGAGRRIRRQEVRGMKAAPASEGDWQCVTLREERLIEEAPHAYKPIGAVIDAQVDAGLIAGVARLRPWVTFKA